MFKACGVTLQKLVYKVCACAHNAQFLSNLFCTSTYTQSFTSFYTIVYSPINYVFKSVMCLFYTLYTGPTITITYITNKGTS